jgi:hypothetical protein
MSTTTSPKATANAPARLPAGTGRPLPLWYSVTLGGFVAVATSYGLLTRPYRLVTDLLSATWLAQDAVTLLVVPVLVWSAQRAAAGSLRAHLLWIGVQTWTAYCYLHLAFGAPFNAMFLVYVVVLGLAGYGMLDGIVRLDVVAAARALAPAPQRAAAWFLAIGGVGIAGLWLSDIVPALIASDLPTEIHLGELANPTWVIDLAWIIPLSIGTAMLLARRHPAGPALAATLLVALLLLSLAMLAIAPFALAQGLHADTAVATQLAVFSGVFGVLGAIEATLLAVGARRMQPEAGPWLRRGWWTWR